MGAHRTNMVSAKLFCVALLVAVAINLHSTDAACALPQTYSTGAATTATTAYTTLSAFNELCNRACAECGQLIGTDTNPTSGSLGTAAVVSTLGSSICPTIAFATPTIGAAGVTANAAFGLPVYTADAVGAVNVPGRFMPATTNDWTDTAGTTQFNVVCPCLTATAYTCGTCGCSDLGFPTLAPTSAPTTAPTVNTQSPTDSSNINISDDSLNSGDIAGIVIGAVGGSFLFLLIGVLVGGMVGGKSTAAAAPAGQL